MQVREKFAYPPFGSMARLVVRGPDAHAAEQWAEHLASTLRSADQREQLRVLGPAPAPIEKLRGNFRFHCLVQSRCGATLRTLLAQVIDGWNPPPTVQWIVDIDPTDML